VSSHPEPILTNLARAPVYFLARPSTTLPRVPPERSPGPSWVLPCALALLAAAVRSVRFARAAVMMNDGPEFIGLAQRIAAGDWSGVIGHGFHPLYPFALRWVEPLTGDWELAGVAVSVAAGALAVLALWWLLEAAFDRRIAALGAFLLAVHPIATEQADVQSDALFLALFLASASALWRALERVSGGWGVAAGLCAGAAYLARPEGLAALVVGCGLAALELAHRHWNVSQAARVAGALVVGGALGSAPLVVALSAQKGALTLTGKKSVASVLSAGGVERRRDRPLDPQLAERPDHVEPPRDESPLRHGAQATGWQRHPIAVARVANVSLKALRPEIALLLFWGILALRGRPGARGRFFLAWTLLFGAVLLGLSASSGYVSRRHALPPLVLLLGYAAVGAFALAAALARLCAPRLSGRAATALVVALLALAGLGKGLRADRTNALVERRAAEWLRAEKLAADGDAVAAVKRRVAWYAGAPFVDLRRVPHPALLLPYLHRERARFAIVDDEERATLLELLADQPDAARLLHTERDDSDAAFVYEIPPG
jgi:hypothetical protein